MFDFPIIYAIKALKLLREKTRSSIKELTSSKMLSVSILLSIFAKPTH